MNHMLLVLVVTQGILPAPPKKTIPLDETINIWRVRLPTVWQARCLGGLHTGLASTSRDVIFIYLTPDLNDLKS